MVDIIGFSDNFNDNSISASWTASGDTAQVIERGGEMVITHSTGPQYNQIITTNAYDIDEKVCFVELMNAGNQSLASHGAIFFIRKHGDDNNKIFFTVSSNTILCFKVVASVQTQVGSNVSYLANTHRWFRFRESGSTLYWDYSKDCANWINITSLSNPFGTTSFDIALQSGCYNFEGSGSFAIFDNLNFGRGVRLFNPILRPRPFKPGTPR